MPKIRARIEEQLSRLDSIEIDKGRLEQEMIFYIEKLDVTEEKTRLRTLSAYFLDTMGERQGDRAPQGQGKSLASSRRKWVAKSTLWAPSRTMRKCRK